MRTFLIIVAIVLVLAFFAAIADDTSASTPPDPDEEIRRQRRREAEERRRRARDEARAEFLPGDGPGGGGSGGSDGSTRRPAPSSSPKPRRRPDAHDGPLRLRRRADVWRPDDQPSADGLPITELTLNGEIYVPYDGYPVTLTVRAFDVTDGSDVDERYGIGCSIDGMHDENGFLEFTQDIHIPYEATTLTDFAVGAIPDFALTLPNRGRRRVLAFAMFAPQFEPDEVFSYGTVEFDMDFARVGYLEWEDHALEQEEHLVRIFVAASAVDGALERSEIDAIKQFFSTRYEGRDDAQKWKSSASATLRSTVSDLKEKRTTPGQLMNMATRAIVAAEEPEVSRTAYEVAVRAVAADGAVNAKEESLLGKLASALGLEDAVVRELRERNLRASMFEHAEDESVLGMPAGLDDDAKRAWLSSEYAKWRGRVSHSNPEVASEAAIRLERIAKLRTSLS